MYIFFNKNLKKTLKSSTPSAIRRYKKMKQLFTIFIYVITLSSTACGYYGNICI